MSHRARPSDKYRVKVLGLEDYQALVACRDACPLQTDTKGYARAIAEGDYERAYRIARQTNPLVAVCSRVCQAPCEDACRRRRVGDGPVAIRALKRFACERHGTGSGLAVREAFGRLEEEGRPAGDTVSCDVLGLLRLARVRGRGDLGSRERGDRVAVVGSGPAGLAAAHDLALLGYRVTIYEAASAPGGMLRWGIPEFRLPRDVVRTEIEAILELGVELKLNSPIGKARTIDDLKREGHRAVFLAFGLQASRWLALEGSDLAGIWGGISYLRSPEEIPVGRRCLVIGGGGVAIDCAQRALRQGAQAVTVACLESWEEMPARDSEKGDAEEEGIRFFPSLGPKRFLGEGGHVRAVEFLEVESVFDSQGNFHPTLRPGTEKILEADTVLLAVGQSSEGSLLNDLADLETTSAGTIRVDENLATNVPGVFAGGDILAGPQSVVHAISEGKKAARSIDEYLSGRHLVVTKRAWMRVLEPGFAAKTDSKGTAAARSPKRPVEQRIADHEEIELPYEEDQARRQAARCRQCHVQTVFDRSLCILCGTCVDTCVENAYKMVRLEDLEGDEKVERLTKALTRRGPPGRRWTAIIKDETRCVRCGVCARRCPTGAITMEGFHIEEEWEHA